MNLFKALTGGLGAIAGKAYGAFQEGKNLKTQAGIRKEELAAAIHTKALDNVAAGKLAEAQWNSLSVKKAGWRPGFITILLSIPLVLVFIPPMVPHVNAGFAALETTPEWYRVLIGVMVSSAFGVKKISDYFMDKKFTLSDGKAND